MAPFVDIDERPKAGESKFRKTEFLSLDEGQHIISFLQENAPKKYAHWISGAYIECLGESCPICENNKKIIYENPEDYSKVKGYTYKRERFAVNVLDKTSGEVKVLTGGRNLFEAIDIMAQATKDDNNEVVDIRTYDWLLIVTGEGRDREVTPVPQYRGKSEPFDLKDLELFDTENTIIKLSADEMLDALNGASLKDIFAIRRAKKEVVDGTHSTTPSEIAKNVQESVDKIFKS